MCVVSMIMDHHIDKWHLPTPLAWPIPQPAVLPWTPPALDWPPLDKLPTREQFQELIDLLKMGKRIDDAIAQPDCELESKKQILRELAKKLGVDIQL